MKDLILNRKRIWTWTGAALAALVFVWSSLFPKTAYDTRELHVRLEDGEQEREIVLTPDTTVLFSFSAGDQTVDGIQPCADWGSENCPGGVLLVDVWCMDEGGERVYAGQGSAPLNAELRRAYTYIALPHEGELSGELSFAIRYVPAEGETAYPSLVATDRDIGECLTVVNEEVYGGDLLLYYVTVRDTYPLLFDAKLVCLLLICIALSMEKAPGKEACA